MREDESVLRLFSGLISEEEYQEVKNKAIHPVHPLVELKETDRYFCFNPRKELTESFQMSFGIPCMRRKE